MFFVTPGQLENLKVKVGNIDVRLQNSFENVKADINNLYSWVDYLHSVAGYQGSMINEMHSTIKDLPKNKQEIRALIDEFYDSQPFAEKINEILSRITLLEQSGPAGTEIATLKLKVNEILKQHPSVFEALADMRRKLDSYENKVFQASPSPTQDIQNVKRKYSKPKLQEKIIRTVARSSKEYVKNLILQQILKQKNLSALQLREDIVEQQGIASKSSFYRMLEELEKEGLIGMMRVGKGKHYFAVQTSKVV